VEASPSDMKRLVARVELGESLSGRLPALSPTARAFQSP
jgi:hypothetical protein